MRTVEQEFAEVLQGFPDARMERSTDGTNLVTLPSVALPAGWSQAATHVRFVVPTGYPYAVPDCFWADQGLRLATGAMPQNTAMGNTVPGQPDPATLWFSWHVTSAWTPGRSTLMTYVKVVRRRFEAIQ